MWSPHRSEPSRPAALADLYEFVEQGIFPAGITEGSLALRYHGRRGDLLVGIASVDASLNYVFPSRTTFDPQLLFPGIRWRADGVYNTIDYRAECRRRTPPRRTHPPL